MENVKRDWKSMTDVDEAVVWGKVSKTGTQYLSGLVKVEGKEYRLTLFKNNKREDSDTTKPVYTFTSKEYQQKRAEEQGTAPAKEDSAF